MAISFVGVATNKGNAAGGTTITVNAPTGCQAGDMIYLIICSDGGGNPSNAGYLSPGTWTWEGGVDSRSHWFYKAYASGETTYTFQITGTETIDSYAIVAVAYRGVLNSDPSDGDWNNSSTDPPATAFTHTSGTLTNVNTNNWWICIFTSWRADGAKSWSSASGVERADVADTTAAVDNGSVAVYDSNGPIATGDYAITATISTAQDRMLHAHLAILQYDPAYVERPNNQLMLTGIGK